MSEIDHDELPDHGWFDSESELPRISSVDSTLANCVNVSFPSADHIREVRALEIRNRSATGPAPNTGILVGHGPQEWAESRREFSRYLNPYSPSKQVTFTDPVSPSVVHG